MQNDLQLLRAIGQGDRQAFNQFYHVYKDRVYNTALSYCQQKQEAEEVTQEVFVRIFRSAARFKGIASVNTWVYRIVVNTALNQLKKRKRWSLFSIGDVASEQSDFDHPGVLLENKEKAQLLFKTIATLPESQKTAFILSFVEELPRQEVADIMDVSLKAVESLLQRAKKNLREKLRNEYPNRRK